MKVEVLAVWFGGFRCVKAKEERSATILEKNGQMVWPQGHAMLREFAKIVHLRLCRSQLAC